MDILAKLDRAHRMSCSDPDDPARKTLYSEAAAAIRAAHAAAALVPSDISEARVRSDLDLVRRWTGTHDAETVPGYYPAMARTFEVLEQLLDARQSASRAAPLDLQVVSRLRAYAEAKRAQLSAEGDPPRHDVVVMFNGLELRLGDLEHLLAAVAAGD
ncbi:hypothetical protein ACXR2T_08135 [Leucobacter sp. HY1910]